ncbi:DUF779 domain-containing protein [soil metagenome]
MPPRALITAAAVELLTTLQERHGALMFHQSGGCCDGSSPMCYPEGDFLVGDRDVLLGLLDTGAKGFAKQPSGVPVWIGDAQFELWKNTQLVIDAVPGRGGGFSLEAPEGMRFLSRGRAFTDAEIESLQAEMPVTGVQAGVAFVRGGRIPNTGSSVVADVVEACPVR